MQYDEFIQRIQEYAGVDDSEQAVRVTEAVLGTLGERLYRTEQSQLAAQLPRGIREFLTAEQTQETTRGQVERYGLEEFYNRVSARADIGYPHAVKLARGVMGVLQEAVSAGEIEQIKQELPDEYDKLFQRLSNS
jgi:uncharacterized protein (DUF2267 family)